MTDSTTARSGLDAPRSPSRQSNNAIDRSEDTANLEFSREEKEEEEVDKKAVTLQTRTQPTKTTEKKKGRRILNLRIR